MGTAEALLAVARGELGTKESPAGSNRVKYSAWYGLTGPWCVMFVQWCFDRAGVTLPARTASCTALMRAAKAAGCWVTAGYRSGDVVVYDWGGDGAPDHCGIAEAVSGAKVTAIEGNTAVGNDSNGGEVLRRTRPLASILGAVRPVYGEEESAVRYRYLKDVPAAFRPAIEALMDAGIIRGDGSDPDGNGDVIDLTHDQVRTLVFCYRGGAFNARLRAAGLETAVEGR